MAVEAFAEIRPNKRPSIRCLPGELQRLVREAEAALVRNGGIYQRGGQLVRIACLDSDLTNHGVKRAAGSHVIIPVTLDYLRLALSRAADFKRFDGRSRALIDIDPPTPIAKSLMSASGEWQLPVLTGLIAAPTLRNDGSLLDIPGYDPASGLYGAFDASQFPKINRNPPRQDAVEALELVRALFSECQFTGGANSAHASVVIAATITAAVRHALPTAPAFGLSAHKAGSGKTTTASAIAQICTGHKPPVLAFSEDEAEFRKAILAMLIAGDAVILLDNVARPVNSAALCALLTNATYSDRILGVNQRAVVPTASTWLLTGNHLEFVGDLTSRVLLSVLDPEVERPESRDFKRNLGVHVTEHRGELLAAALTIVLAYIAAGEPTVDGPRSRFPEWDRLVRRPLLWLGEADPLQTQSLLEAADPERESLTAVMDAWVGKFGDRAATVAMAAEAALNRPPLLEALQSVAGDLKGTINTRRLGRWLSRNVRRIEGGRRFEHAGADRVTKRQMYRVSSVIGVSGVSANPIVENEDQEIPRGIDADNAGYAGHKCQSCSGEGCNWCSK